MKKRIALILSSLLLLICLASPAVAQGMEFPYVTDLAGLLTDSQVAALEEKAASISRQYSFGVYILSFDDYQRYANAYSITDAVIQIYDGYGLGAGADRAGATLMLSMAQRDYVLDFYSSRADRIFTEAGRDRLEDHVVSLLGSGDYYNAFDTYLNLCKQYLQDAENGTPYGQGVLSRQQQADRETSVMIALVVGIVVSVLTGVCLAAPMRSAREKTHANEYVENGSLRLTHRSDMFIRRSVSRRPRQTNNSSGGSHGHSYSRGGHSGRSGKF